MEIARKLLKNLTKGCTEFTKVYNYANNYFKNEFDPRDCFLPDEACLFTSSGKPGIPYLPEPATKITSHTQLASLSLFTWYFTQDIYRFNSDLFVKLIETPFPEKLPVDLFNNLPNWCIYIELKDFIYEGLEIEGFFVSKNYLIKNRKHFISIIVVPKHLSKGFHVMRIPIDEDDSDRSYFVEDSKKIIPLILYICSQEPDIQEKPNWNFKPLKPYKKGLRSELPMPPRNPKIWNVGQKIGKILKEQRETYNQQERSGIRPHIRRGHWHMYWTGSKSDKQTFIHKWLPPTIVTGTNTAQKD